MAASCSTMTRVVEPRIVTSGRKLAGRALVDVGATITVERSSRSLSCTTTAKRAPRCSRPRVSRRERSR
jgi:hypothetical protein